MKKLLLAGLFLATAAPMAMAGGANITWGDGCWSDLHSSLQTFACDDNSPTRVFRMTVSCQLDEDMPDFIGVLITLQGMSGTTTLPDWWMLDSGKCRNDATNPSFSADFTATTPKNCSDYWGGGGGYGGFGYLDYLTPGSGLESNRTIMRGWWGLSDTRDMAPDVEWLIGQFRFTAYKTLGADACAGCETPMRWAVHDVLVSANTRDVRLQDPIPTSFYGGNIGLCWQSLADPCTWVATRNSTWGQIKSFYR